MEYTGRREAWGNPSNPPNSRSTLDGLGKSVGLGRVDLFQQRGLPYIHRMQTTVK